MKFKLIVAAVLVLTFGWTHSIEAATVYTVAKNDSLSRIALNMCGDAGLYQRIASENGIANPDLIRVGQKLDVTCAAKVAAQESVGVVDTLRLAPDATVTVTAASVPVYQTSASRAEIIDYVIDQFGLEAAATHALPIIMGESGFRLNAKGYNCYYRKWNGRRYSRACDVKDRHRAWSVDCGLMQINTPGRTCPSELYTLEGNVAAGKRKLRQQGWRAWVQYKTGAYRVHTDKFAHLLSSPRAIYASRTPAQNTVVDTLRAVTSAGTDTLRFVGNMASARVETVVITTPQVISLRE